MNFKDLNRILKFKIFLHKDGQFRAAHVTLGYTLISTCFQSLKHVSKDRRSCWRVSQAAELIAQQVTNLIQVEEEPISSEKEQEETAREPSFVDLEEDFKAFNQPDLTKHFRLALDLGPQRKLASTKGSQTYQKEWSSKRRLPICWPCWNPTRGVPYRSPSRSETSYPYSSLVFSYWARGEEEKVRENPAKKSQNRGRSNP